MIQRHYNSIFLLLLLMMLHGTLFSQSLKTFEENIYRAYISDNMKLWESSMKKMENDDRRNSSEKFLLHLTITQYGYTGYLIGTGRDDEAEKLLNKTVRNAEKLKSTSYKAEAYALLAGLNGYEIGLAKHKAPFLGKKSQKLTGKSLELTRINPLGWMEKGNIYYHMPGFFGGSYDKAKNYYSNAVMYFDQTPYLPAWLKLNALVWLAKTHEANGNFEEAASTYRKALKIEPEFNWVKNELYPGLQKKM